MSDPNYLDRAGRIAFSELLAQLYDAATGKIDVKDPTRFSLEPWLGYSANTNVKDYTDAVLTKARHPRLVARVASTAVSATLLQNELIIYSGIAMADPTRYIRPQTKYMVNNPAFFTLDNSADYPDMEQASVQKARTIAEIPQTEYDTPLTPEDFNTYLYENSEEVAFIQSIAARELAMDTREPIESLRPMTTQDLYQVRGLIKEIIEI